MPPASVLRYSTRCRTGIGRPLPKQCRSSWIGPRTVIEITYIYSYKFKFFLCQKNNKSTENFINGLKRNYEIPLSRSIASLYSISPLDWLNVPGNKNPSNFTLNKAYKTSFFFLVYCIFCMFYLYEHDHSRQIIRWIVVPVRVRLILRRPTNMPRVPEISSSDLYT